jgi:DHA2 family multidrug resistance protein
LLQSSGASAVDAMHRANALIAQLVQEQAVLLSYIDTFWLMAMVCAFAFPLAFLIRPIPLGKGLQH